MSYLEKAISELAISRFGGKPNIHKALAALAAEKLAEPEGVLFDIYKDKNPCYKPTRETVGDFIGHESPETIERFSESFAIEWASFSVRCNFKFEAENDVISDGKLLLSVFDSKTCELWHWWKVKPIKGIRIPERGTGDSDAFCFNNFVVATRHIDFSAKESDKVLREAIFLVRLYFLSGECRQIIGKKSARYIPIYEDARKRGRHFEEIHLPATQWAVRGFFRWQAHGKGRKKRKLIFIAGHFRQRQSD